MPKFYILLIIFISVSIEAADFVGGDNCSECHKEQVNIWQGSHHDLAMQTATEKSVLGNFNNIEFKQFDVISTFYKKNKQYWVRTDGSDGQLKDYQIKYTFGVSPLQQYLIEFTGGRLQVLDIAWDSRLKTEGGQRWYHLHPKDKVEHNDILHWTGPNLNWNYMCADCHSTNLKKNYNAEKQTYDTQWTDINVSCEACHGPGSDHIHWAKSPGQHADINKGLAVRLNESRASWHTNKKSGKPTRSSANHSRAEIQVCARCHSRRSQLTDEFIPGQPFMNAFHPSLLSSGLYYADGQMRDEVYVWGSFRQSKMYEAGVTCSNCHDPHSTKLKLPDKQVCYQCHEQQHYAKQSHHFHKNDSPGSDCIECHMPTTTFMGIDNRHDHSFRIPRPILSVTTELPNACNGCHKTKTAEWSTQHLNVWLNQNDSTKTHKPHPFAKTFLLEQSGQTDSSDLLLRLAMDNHQASIIRATAFSRFDGTTNRTKLLSIQQGLLDESPLIRQGALDALRTQPISQRIIAFPLVWDEILSVRIQAARLLAGYSLPDKVTTAQKIILKDAIDEYIDAQRFNSERPEAQVNLGGVYSDLGEYTKAKNSYLKAIELQPLFVPAYVNFAQMLSEQNNESGAEKILNNGIKNIPDSADIQHALGLTKIRQKDLDSALLPLSKAAQLAPNSNRYIYVYAVALHSAGRLDEAIEQLKYLLNKNPEDFNTLYTLVTFNKDAGRNRSALLYAKQMQTLAPENIEIKKLVKILNTASQNTN